MNLKARTYVEDQKTAAERKMAARQAILGQNGQNAAAIGRDTLIRELKAEIRKARLRLKSIAAQEKLVADKAQAKEQKLADKLAEKKAGGAKPKAAPEKKVEAKGAKKEKKPKEKKAAAPAQG